MYQRRVLPQMGMMAGMPSPTQQSGVTLPQMPMTPAMPPQQPGLLSGMNPMMLAGLMRDGPNLMGNQGLLSGLAGGRGVMNLNGLEDLPPDMIAQLAGGRFGGLG